MTPFRSEKNTNWEGAFRVPLLVRWPGKIPAGVVSNEIVQHHDWLPTFLAAAGEPDIVEKLKEGHEAAGKTFKVHIDGYNLLPYLTGEEDESPRKGFIYFSDDGDLVALRFDNWKVVFMEQRARARSSSGPSRSSRCGSEALQPAHRSVRAGGHDVEHLLGLVPVEGLHDHGRAGDRRPSSSRRSRSSRRGRRRRASPSTRRWRRWRTPRAGARRLMAEPRLLERHARRSEAIVEFVESARAQAVPPEERVAVFDNDGTLWCEKPMPIELGFILERLAEMAEAGRIARERQPWKAALRARLRAGWAASSTSTTRATTPT